MSISPRLSNPAPPRDGREAADLGCLRLSDRAWVVAALICQCGCEAFGRGAAGGCVTPQCGCPVPADLSHGQADLGWLRFSGEAWRGCRRSSATESDCHFVVVGPCARRG